MTAREWREAGTLARVGRLGMRAWWPMLLAGCWAIASCAGNGPRSVAHRDADARKAAPIQARLEVGDASLPFGQAFALTVVLSNKGDKPLLIDTSLGEVHIPGRCGGLDGLRGSRWGISIAQDLDRDGHIESLIHTQDVIRVGSGDALTIPPGGQHSLRHLVRDWAPPVGTLPSLKVPGPGQVYAELYLLVEGRQLLVGAGPVHVQFTGRR